MCFVWEGVDWIGRPSAILFLLDDLLFHYTYLVQDYLRRVCLYRRRPL